MARPSSAQRARQSATRVVLLSLLALALPDILLLALPPVVGVAGAADHDRLGGIIAGRPPPAEHVIAPARGPG